MEVYTTIISHDAKEVYTTIIRTYRIMCTARPDARPTQAGCSGPQGHGHPLGCRHLHPLEDAPQRDRGHHLGGSSSIWRCSRKGLACSSSSSSGDESFCTCLEHATNVMKLCSFMRMAELLAQQPVLSGAVVFGVCVCGRVSTRESFKHVTCHRPSTTHDGRAPGAYAS